MLRNLTRVVSVAVFIVVCGAGAPTARAMSDAEFVDEFNVWLETLPLDVEALAAVESGEGRLFTLGGLSYLLYRDDMVPDDIEGIGWMDEAMVLRVAALQAMEAGLGKIDPEVQEAIEALAGEAWVVEEFLGETYTAFYDYVLEMPFRRDSGYLPASLFDDPEDWEKFEEDVEDELRGYRPKPLAQNTRTLRELKSFIKSKVK